MPEENLMQIFSEDKLSNIHSDLTIENIICKRDEINTWYLIDPNTGSLHETPFLDYAKLLQSLHGKYEFLMMVNNVRVENNKIDFLFSESEVYHKLYNKYKAYLFSKFTENEVKSIYFHEAIHWLRLMPYKIKKNPQTAVIFYGGMLAVLDDIEEMFYGKKKKISNF